MSDVGFKSAGANKPARDTHDSVLTRHAELVAAIIAAKPYVIRYEADAIDLKDRAEHIEALGKAFLDYVTEIRDDTAYTAPRSIDCDTGALSDAIDDIVGTIRRAADEMAAERGKSFW